MLTVGITGQIASGKSVVAREFARLGAVVISGDEIGKNIVEDDPLVLKQLVRAFGQGIMNRNKKLDRRALGRIAFGTPQFTDKLNSIVHPPLLKKLRSEIERHRKAGRASMIVVDAALIFEWGLEKELDKVIVVESKTADQVMRLEKLGLTRAEIRDRLRRQIPKYRQRKLADMVIRNIGTLAELKLAAASMFERLCYGLSESRSSK